MMPRVAASALLMSCLAACGEDPTRAVIVSPDPARYAECPAAFPPAPKLAPLSTFKLPDGREVVLFDVVLDREVATGKFILDGREAWFRCRSAVKYTIDWIDAASSAPPVKK